MQGFRFLPHSVTSDVAFEAFGKTETELFVHAAEAAFSVMTDLKKVAPKEERKVELASETLKDLLFDFLNELVFLKDRDRMLFSKFLVTIKRRKELFSLAATVYGESIDPQKHNLGVDVKAATLHDFKLQKQNGTYKATVVLDI